MHKDKTTFTTRTIPDFPELTLEIEDSTKIDSIIDKRIFDILSHQLRTPLTSINWYSEILNEKEHNSQEAQEIHKSARNMTRIVADLLLSIDLELGTYRVENTKNNLRDSILLAIKNLDYKEKIVNIRMSSKKSENYFINCDKKLLEASLYHIMQNSIDHASKNEVEIWLELKKDSNNCVSLMIKDSGTPLVSMDLQTLLSRYSRGEESRFAVPNGSGLGLHIVSSFMRLSQGELQISANKETGWSVSLSFTS
ncbi:HAMP domain-containing histidine kinase [Candidatus Dojkabacteria bacterium]|uniref:histidine kinase n=1 Tax=Candidatus Dojkabacteria bacterium TaxID=2099670 RepID=A0A952DV20_9BACT|nr:HAMP domain-containing histidine kinase [Candidatus Dojkabacteria bacterium]